VIMALILADFSGHEWWAAGAYVVAAATDSLDGYLARSRGWVTVAGAFLDPLADKLLVCGALVALAARSELAWLPVLIIVGREVAVSVWRWLAARRGVSVPARRLGKWKANAQFFAVALVLFPPAQYQHELWNAVLGLAVALSVLSAIDLVLATRQGPPAPPPDALRANGPALGRPEVRGASGAREV